MADQLLTGTTLIEDKRSERGNVWSCTGTKFVTREPNTADVIRGNATGLMTSQADDITGYASVELPNGATVTSVAVYGNAAAAAGITWTLYKMNIISGGVVAMASAAVNTADITITQPTIDNANYGYFLMTGFTEWDINDVINGAIIKYD